MSNKQDWPQRKRNGLTMLLVGMAMMFAREPLARTIPQSNDLLHATIGLVFGVAGPIVALWGLAIFIYAGRGKL